MNSLFFQKIYIKRMKNSESIVKRPHQLTLITIFFVKHVIVSQNM